MNAWVNKRDLRIPLEPCEDCERLERDLAAAKEDLKDSLWRERQWKKAAEDWMKAHDKLKAKYEPLVAVPSAQEECPACTRGEYPHRNCFMR